VARPDGRHRVHRRPAGRRGRHRRTFGAYVTPSRPLLGALAVLAVSVALDVVGFRLNRRLNWAVVAIVVVALGLVVATCLAVPPPPITNAPDADQPLGLLTSAGILVFAFLASSGSPRPASTSRRSPPAGCTWRSRCPW